MDYRWKPEALREAIKPFPGLKLQKTSEQSCFKVSYDVNPEKAPTVRDIRTQLRKRDLHAKLIYSQSAYLDLLPVRASKGLAVQYLMIKWGIDPNKILVCGDSGNDEEMLRGNNLAVVVANHSEELAKLRGRANVYFSDCSHAWGILDGMQYYQFLSTHTNFTDFQQSENQQKNVDMVIDD